MEELDKKIGEKLKTLREKLGFTMREVAQRTNIDHSYVGKIEKGQIPTLDKLKKFCDLYGITVSSLFGEEVPVPEEMKTIGVEWITFAEEMKKQNLTPDEIKNIMAFLKTMKKL